MTAEHADTKMRDAFIDTIDGLNNVRGLLHIACLAFNGPNVFGQEEVDAMAMLVGQARDKLDAELKAINATLDAMPREPLREA